MLKIENETFYPTPKPLIERMIKKIQRKEPWSMKVLEPSAGKGDIVDALTEGYSSMWGRNTCHIENVYAIEIDETLQATLRGKRIKVLDSDFLSFSGPDKFDLIIGNPPFNNGELHLLKAIDIMYRGEIVFLLNAETIKNPHTNIRKSLINKLDELNADIEYIQNAFKTAERPTGVEVALIHIEINNQVEEDIFNGLDSDDTNSSEDQSGEFKHEVSNRKTIQELVAEYNQLVNIGTETTIGYYKNYPKIGKYVGLNREPDKYISGDGDMTTLMQSQVNELLILVRKDFWMRLLDLPDIKKRMTAKRLDEFNEKISKQCDMDFTEKNIRQFILNLINNYEEILMKAVLEIFDTFTIKHNWSEDNLYDDNIHYFNGWKTNKAFKIGKKVIIPIYASYSNPFIESYSGKWKLDYSAIPKLSDIDKVWAFFSANNHAYTIVEALNHAFERGESRKIQSSHFTLTAYKKGTLHIQFDDEDVLRRFNLAACRGKNWLPHEYGKKPYQAMDMEEKAVVDSFEGEKSYTKHLNQPVFAIKKDQLQLEYN